MLRESIAEVKANLEDKNAPFGVDLLLPQVGGGARKTNVGSRSSCCIAMMLELTISQYDYTAGQLPELTDVIIQGGAKLFICAVGVPPKEMVERLHSAGIAVMK